MTKLNEANTLSLENISFVQIYKTMLKLIDHFNIHLVATKSKQATFAVAENERWKQNIK